MALNSKQLRDEIVKPVLKHLGLYSPSAVELVMGTIAQESLMGTYLRQLDNGPALGVCQMEPNTFYDIYENFLKYRPSLSRELRKLVSPLHGEHPKEMISNLAYAVAMCRIHYYRVPEQLPKVGDVPGLASYWKKYYNTHLGKGTRKEFIHNYERYVK